MPLILFFLQNDFYPAADGEFVSIPRNGTTLPIKLQDWNIPEDAFEVILYVYTQNGWLNNNIDDSGTFQFYTTTINGRIQKEIFFHAYSQRAWSYNSDHIDLPVESERIVYAKVDSEKSYGIQCFAKIVGYRKPDEP